MEPGAWIAILFVMIVIAAASIGYYLYNKSTKTPSPPPSQPIDQRGMDVQYSTTPIAELCVGNCGKFKTRELICLDSQDNQVEYRLCEGKEKPDTTPIQCDPCAQWIMDRSECSTTCGIGTQTVTAKCPAGQECDESQKPIYRDDECTETDGCRWDVVESEWKVSPVTLSIGKILNVTTGRYLYYTKAYNYTNIDYTDNINMADMFDISNGILVKVDTKQCYRDQYEVDCDETDQLLLVTRPIEGKETFNIVSRNETKCLISSRLENCSTNVSPDEFKLVTSNT
jgi:hypothetical protein